MNEIDKVCVQDTISQSKNREKWHKRFLQLAYLIAGWSKDLSTQVGCVVIGPDREIRTTGYNGFPRGVVDEEIRQQRPAKYMWTSCAEQNAVAQAARIGVSLLDCTAYVTHPPCAVCCRQLIQAGIKSVIYSSPPPDMAERWAESMTTAIEMFKEANVYVHEIKND